MRFSSVDLIKCCIDDFLPSGSCKADYFPHDISEENEEILLGIYQGMIKIIEHEKLKDEKTMIITFNEAFKNNKLVELIHECYNNPLYKDSGYYKKFCELNLKINTYINWDTCDVCNKSELSCRCGSSSPWY